MKRMIRAALAATLLLPGLLAVHARANDDADGPKDGPRHEMGDRMKERLGLTDEQASKFKDAMKAHMEAMKPIGEKMKAGIKSLRDQVKAKASDGDIKATLASLKAARQEMTAEQEKFHEGLASFLTPTQQAKMVLGMAKHMREHMMPGGPEGRGRRGGRSWRGRGGDRPSPRDKDDDGDDDGGE